MSDFDRRVERDLQEIGEYAPSSAHAWRAIRDRIDRDGTDETPETIVLETDAPPTDRRPLLPIVAAAAVLLVVALVVAFVAGGGDDDVDTVEDPTVETTQPPEPEEGSGEFPVSEVDGLSALEVDGTYFQMNQAVCALEEKEVSGGTELVKTLSEGSDDAGQRYTALLTRTRVDDGTEIDKVRLVSQGDPTVDGKLAELQFTAEGEALFEVNGDLVQAAGVVATTPDGSESITASFTVDC